jgi:hypothetical protein
VGDAWLELGNKDVALRDDDPPDAAHMHVALIDGAWRIAEVGMNRTRVNGLPGDGALLVDGDMIERGSTTATFRASRDRWGAARVGDAAVVYLHMSTPPIGLAVDAHGIGAALDHSVVCVDANGPLARAPLGPRLVRTADLEGPSLAEVRTRTARLDVAFDVASAFAVGRMLLASSLAESDVRLTFDGAIVACGLPARPAAPADEARRAVSITLAALELGAAPAQHIAQTVVVQRDRAAAWGPRLFSADAQAHVLALANAAVERPHDVARIFADAARALGEPSPSQVQSVVRELFPRAAQRHARVREELALLGVDALTATTTS